MVYERLKRDDFSVVNRHERELSSLASSASQVLRENIWHDGPGNRYTAAAGKVIPKDEKEARFLYPFQWEWDTAFTAAWTDNPAQGASDIEKFMAAQGENGFLGHIRYNRRLIADYFPPPKIYYPDGVPQQGELTSKITQPPAMAYGAWECAKKLPQNEKAAFLEKVFPQLMKYHEYLYRRRVRNGLMVSIHPWESGDDNSLKWDSIYNNFFDNQDILGIVSKWQQESNPRQVTFKNRLVKLALHDFVEHWLDDLDIPYRRTDLKIIPPDQRPLGIDYDKYLYLINLYNRLDWDEEKMLEFSPFRVQDPMTNAVLLRSNRALLEMADFLGRDVDRAKVEKWQEETREGMDHLWDEQDKIYYAKDLITGGHIRVKTVSSLIPLFSREIPADKAGYLADHIRSLLHRRVPIFIIPSTFPSENFPFFEPKRYWKGPVWPIMNTLLVNGLTYYGFDDLSEMVRNHTLTLLLRSQDEDGGFFEYYHPFDGDGLGSARQTWTAAGALELIGSKPKTVDVSLEAEMV